MSTLRQIEANRRNARKSSGPKTAEGKAVSARNALKTGIYSTAAVLPLEDAELRATLAESFHSRFNPITPEERLHINEFIRAEWELRRLRRAEAELTAFVHENHYDPDDERPLGQSASHNPKIFSGIQWRANSVRRVRNQALATLRSLRENPGPNPPAQIRRIHPVSDSAA